MLGTQYKFEFFFAVSVVRKNINCSIDESIERFRAVCEAAAQRNVPVRG